MRSSSKSRNSGRQPQKALRRSIETTIVVAVEGGLADVVEYSGRPCRIIIRDYDTDGADRRNLTRDTEGRRCFERLFEFSNGA